MADLIAIGYPDETTAEAAADRGTTARPPPHHRARRDRRDRAGPHGDYHGRTRHHIVGAGATWGMFWGLLFGLLFFMPVVGMAIGAGLGALMGKVTKSGIDQQFQDQVRALMKPGPRRCS